MGASTRDDIRVTVRLRGFAWALLVARVARRVARPLPPAAAVPVLRLILLAAWFRVGFSVHREQAMEWHWVRLTPDVVMSEPAPNGAPADEGA